MSIRRRVVALPLIALAFAAAGSAGAAVPALAADDCGTGAASVENGGFETPGTGPNSYWMFPEAEIPPWRTTDLFGVVEIWGDGNGGVPAYEGGNFAELNANSDGTLYQDVVTTPGATMTWTLAHRGRLGSDAMRVLIGDAATADPDGDAGWDYVSGDLVDNNFVWGTHTDSYVVPEGQTCTRFGFRAVSTANGDSSVGNFLDAIVFDISIPAPTPAPTATPDPEPLATPAATARPVVTAPPTDLLPPSGGNDGLGGIALVVLGLLGVSVAVVSRAPVKRRRA